MKKFYYCLAAAAIASLSACSNEDLGAPAGNGDEVAVSFSVDVPGEIQSRAYWNSGEHATQLQYAVYPKGEKTIVYSGNTTLVSLKATVTLNLLRGDEYDVVFWAQNPDAPYSFDAAGQSVNIDYKQQMLANDETLEAFYATTSVTVSNESSSKSVTLKRPFCKIDVMTHEEEDYYVALTANAQGCPNASTFTVKAYSEFNLISESVTGDEQEVTYQPNLYVYDGSRARYKVNGVIYTSLGSIYVLSNPDGGLLDCKYSYGDLTDGVYTLRNKEITFSNLPVKKNQRTIIYGKFLTQSYDFNVAVDKTYDVAPQVPDTGSTELEQTLYSGGTYTMDADTEIERPLSAGSVPAVVDLTNHTLTINCGSVSYFKNSANVTFKNGTIKYIGMAQNNTSISVQSNTNITLENVTLETSGSALDVRGDAATLTLINSTVNASGYYAVATNAATENNHNVVITVEGSTLSSQYGSYINVPGKMYLTGTTINGDIQGLLVRGGTAVIDGCTVNLKAETLTQDSWGSGAFVPHAALTIGNNSNNAYQYVSDVTIKGNSTFNANDGCRALYVWPNAGTGVGVNLTLEGTNTFNGLVQVNKNNLNLVGELPEGYTDLTPTE